MNKYKKTRDSLDTLTFADNDITQMGSMSSMFYEQLLHAQIPKAQKRLTT